MNKFEIEKFPLILNKNYLIAGFETIYFLLFYKI